MFSLLVWGLHSDGQHAVGGSVSVRQLKEMPPNIIYHP